MANRTAPIISARLPHGVLATIRRSAAARGISSSDYLRLALGRFEAMALGTAKDTGVILDNLIRDLGLPEDASGTDLIEAVTALVASLAPAPSAPDPGVAETADAPSAYDRDPTPLWKRMKNLGMNGPRPTAAPAAVVLSPAVAKLARGSGLSSQEFSRKMAAAARRAPPPPVARPAPVAPRALTVAERAYCAKHNLTPAQFVAKRSASARRA